MDWRWHWLSFLKHSWLQSKMDLWQIFEVSAARLPSWSRLWLLRGAEWGLTSNNCCHLCLKIEARKKKKNPPQLHSSLTQVWCPVGTPFFAVACKKFPLMSSSVLLLIASTLTWWLSSSSSDSSVLNISQSNTSPLQGSVNFRASQKDY